MTKKTKLNLPFVDNCSVCVIVQLSALKNLCNDAAGGLNKCLKLNFFLLENQERRGRNTPYNTWEKSETTRIVKGKLLVSYICSLIYNKLMNIYIIYSLYWCTFQLVIIVPVCSFVFLLSQRHFHRGKKDTLVIFWLSSQWLNSSQTWVPIFRTLDFTQVVGLQKTQIKSLNCNGKNKHST